MRVKIEWLENKTEDWKVASITDDRGSKITEVSINKTSKKGEAFPNFESLMVGMEVEGELWQSNGGKWYLFPPKPQTPTGGANRGNGGAFKSLQIEKAQERTHAHVTEAQDRKEFSIKVSSTFSQASAMALAEWQEQKRISPHTSQSIEALFIKWREWLWRNYDVAETDYPPF